LFRHGDHASANTDADSNSDSNAGSDANAGFVTHHEHRAFDG
jgi:hypothetical protein